MYNIVKETRWNLKDEIPLRAIPNQNYNFSLSIAHWKKKTAKEDNEKLLLQQHGIYKAPDRKCFSKNTYQRKI